MLTKTLKSSAKLPVIMASCFSLVFSSCYSQEPDHSHEIASLKETSKGFSYVAKKATPAVVSIEVEVENQRSPLFGRHPFFGDDDPFDFFQDDFFKNFFGHPHRRQERPKREAPPSQGRGSGCIVSSDGTILTNHHVIKDASKITVVLNSGEQVEGRVIGSDPGTDVAVVKIDKKNLPHLSLGDSDALEVGEWVVAIGNPMGLQASVTSGIVSAKGRSNLNITNFGDLIQTDAAINPGNSGGPLLNLEGEVIGLNTAIISTSGGYMGIGFAIPSKILKHIMGQLINNGEVARGYLGIVLQQLDKELAESFQLEGHQGALITDVVADSPADKAGLKRGDIITHLNGNAVKDPGMLSKEVGLMSPGSKVKLDVSRNGKSIESTVTLGNRENSGFESPQNAEKLGLDVEGNSGGSGVTVNSVTPGSPAHMAGINVGDAILSVNKKEVSTPAEFWKEAQNSLKEGRILMLVKHKRGSRYVLLNVK